MRAVIDTNVVVSGDSHLLNLKEYRGIPILTVVDVLNHLARSS